MMSELSEEEIIDILQNVIADEVIGTYCLEIQKTTNCAKNCEKEDCYLIQAIQGIVDLYQKEKQKYNDMINCCNELMKQISKEKDLNNELQIRYKIEHEKYLEEKNKNKTIEIFSQHMPANTEIVCMSKDDFERNFSSEYIHKDKMREKIEYLTKELEKVEQMSACATRYDTIQKLDVQINCLEDLLGD